MKKVGAASKKAAVPAVGLRIPGRVTRASATSPPVRKTRSGQPGIRRDVHAGAVTQASRVTKRFIRTNNTRPATGSVVANMEDLQLKDLRIKLIRLSPEDLEKYMRPVPKVTKQPKAASERKKNAPVPANPRVTRSRAPQK